MTDLVTWVESEADAVADWLGVEIRGAEKVISADAAVAWADIKSVWHIVSADLYGQMKPLAQEVIASGEKDLAILEQNLVMLAETKAAALVPILQQMESNTIQFVIAFIMALVTHLP